MAMRKPKARKTGLVAILDHKSSKMSDLALILELVFSRTGNFRDEG